MKRLIRITSLLAVNCTLCAAVASAQSGSLTGSSALSPYADGRRPNLAQMSLIYQPAPRVRVFKEEDLVQVKIKYDWVYNNNTTNQRKKNIKTRGRVTAWFKIPDIFAFPVKSEETLPEVGGEINHQTQNQGTMQRRENFGFTVKCRVVSVQDNGNLYVEGTQSFDFGEEGKRIFVGGFVRPEDIIGNTVDSSDVAELVVQETPEGNVFDTVRRPWGTRLFEHWKPF